MSNFVGRERELEELGIGLQDVASGRGRLFLLSGEPGIGKSRLADEAAAQARTRGLLVAWGRCWEAGGAPAYWPWVQVMRAWLRGRDAAAVTQTIGGAAESICQLLPEVAQLFPEVQAVVSVDPESARFQLFDAAASFFRSAASADPMVIVLEDIHAADTPSLLLLQFLASQMAETNLMVLATYRDIELTPEHPLTGVVADLVRGAPTRLIHLRGFGEQDVALLVGTAGVQPSPPLVSALHRKTNGNPLFVNEAVRLLTTEGDLERFEDAATLRVSVPRGIRDVIARRLGHLDEACGGTLSAASVLGTEFTAEALGRLLGAPLAELRDVLDRALNAGLLAPVPGSLGRFRFSHGLVRETLYGDLTSAERMRHHRRAAEVLQDVYGTDQPAHLAELAHHFVEGAPLGDAATAVHYARQAAEAAASSLAYEEAARLYGMALMALELEGPSDEQQTMELLLAEGDVLARAGDLAGARATFLRAAAIARRRGNANQLGRAALGYGGRFLWARAGDDQHLVPLLEEALVLLGGEDDHLRVRLLARLACALRNSPDRSRSDTLSRQALDIARELGDHATLGYTLVGRFWAVWWPENQGERLELASELIKVAEGANDAERVFDGHVAKTATLLELGMLDDARREMDVVAARAKELRQPAQLWPGRAQAPIFALLQGSFHRAEELIASEVRPGQPPTLVSDDLSCHQMHRFLLARERGQLADVEHGARTAAAALPWYPLHRAALACLLLELGRQGEARVVFDDLATNAFEALNRDSMWLLGMCLASEACWGLGDNDAARMLYEQLVPFDRCHAVGCAEGSVGAVSRYLGLLARTTGHADAAEHHLRDAIAMNTQMGASPWAAHARFDLADLLLERDGPGDREQAATELRLAADACDDLGMPALAAKVVRRLEAAGGGRGPAPVQATGPNVLRREGDYWTVAFAGDAFRLRDAKGLHHLAQLLHHPGREFHALDLVTADAGAPSSSPGGRAPEKGMHSGGASDLGPALDDQAKASYRARLRELEDDLDEATAWADSARAERVRNEMEFLEDELTAAVGLGGRDRKVGSPAERARVNVTRAIRSVLDRIREHSPALADHLDATVRTGTFCAYAPDPRSPITWLG
jgi:tetratricopeptide (TPR) repeat protein